MKSEPVFLTDGTRGYFYPGDCHIVEEGRWHNGRSYVSCATGDELMHQRLFITPRGRYILHTYSSRKDVPETYEQITPMKAAFWIMQNGYELPDKMKPFIEDLEM